MRVPSFLLLLLPLLQEVNQPKTPSNQTLLARVPFLNPLQIYQVLSRSRVHEYILCYGYLLIQILLFALTQKVPQVCLPVLSVLQHQKLAEVVNS